MQDGLRLRTRLSGSKREKRNIIMATTASKKVNYTPEMAAKLEADYKAGVVIDEAYSEKMGKSLRSCVAKLSRLGIYKKAEKVSKVTGAAPMTKEVICDQIAERLGVPPETVASLAAATKTALVLVLENLPEVPAA